MKQLLRIIRVLAYRFQKDLCFLRGSALSFSTVLSIVPLLAVMFGVAKGFGIDTILAETLQNEFHDQEEAIKYLIQFSSTLLEQTRGGLVAGIGVITLFYTVLRLLSTIEASLNSMWGLKKSRPLSRKIIDFLALIIICPIFFVISSSLTVFVTAYIDMLKDSTSLIGQVQPMMKKAIAIAPYLISSLLFTFLYLYLPNARVKLVSALLAGVIAGVAYQILQASYISIQIQVSRTGAIYGSFAALPLFLVWLYFSWLIFLFGAEVVVLHEEKLWDPEIAASYRTLSPFEKKLALLCIIKAAVQAFTKKGRPIAIDELASNLKMPARMIAELSEELIAGHILFKCESGFLPAKNADTLRLYDVIFAHDGENHLLSNSELPIMKAFENKLLAGRKLLSESETNSLIRDV